MFRLLILLAIAAAAGFVTKPSAEALEEKILEDLRVAYATNDGERDDGLGGLLNLGCRFAPAECARLSARSMETEISDYVAFKLGEVRYGNESLTCIGAFAKWWCLDPGSDGIEGA